MMRYGRYAQPGQVARPTTGLPRQAVAREAFIVACLELGLHPDLSAVQWDSGSINLDHSGLGDELAGALAVRCVAWCREEVVRRGVSCRLTIIACFSAINAWFDAFVWRNGTEAVRHVWKDVLGLTSLRWSSEEV